MSTPEAYREFLVHLDVDLQELMRLMENEGLHHAESAAYLLVSTMIETCGVRKEWWNHYHNKESQRIP